MHVEHMEYSNSEITKWITIVSTSVSYGRRLLSIAMNC